MPTKDDEFDLRVGELDENVSEVVRELDHSPNPRTKR